MGYSPGFLVKIGRFQALGNSYEIFTTKPRNSWKSICKHVVDVSGSLGRFFALTQIRLLQNHGLFGQNRSISDLWEFLRNLFEQAPKQLKIHLQGFSRRFREFGTISRTYRNPSSSKPWAIALAFWSKSADFRTLGIPTKSFRISLKTVKNPFPSMWSTFQGVWEDFLHLPKSTLFKTMGPGFLVKIGRFQTLGNSYEIFTNKPQNSWKSFLQGCKTRFRKFWTISRTYRNPPSSKPWAIAQAFCSNSVDFGPLEISRKSFRTSPKTVRNPFAIRKATFQSVWTISRTYKNPPSSKPWAIAQAFWSKSVDFRPLGIPTKSFRRSPKTVKNPFASM